MKPPHACYFLHNKAYLFPPPVPPVEEGAELPEPRPDTTPFWCLKTQDAIGPDGAAIGEDCCGPDRPCYRPEVEL